jgi:hypothetical protein
MGLLQDARKLADTYGPEAARHVGAAADKAWKHGSAFDQEVAKHAGPVAVDTKACLNKLGKQGLHGLSQVPDGHANQEYDWSFISQFGEYMAKHLGSTAGDVWDKLGGGDILHDIGHAAFSKIELTQEGLLGFSERLKDWIVFNPKQFTTLLACIASRPITQFVTPATLGLVGFTPMGIAMAFLEAVKEDKQGAEKTV